MKKKKIMIVGLSISLLSTFCFAEKIGQNFEKNDALKDWEIEGESKIALDQKHAGNNSLCVPVSSSATWRFGKKDKFGKVTIWVYDSCVNAKESKPGKNWDGPYFGLVNSDEDKIVLWVSWREWLKSIWGVCWTAENQFNNCWYPKGTKRIGGWQKFIFDHPDAKTFTIIQDEKESEFNQSKIEYFNKGLSGLIFNGGKPTGKDQEQFYYDDIEISLK